MHLLYVRLIRIRNKRGTTCVKENDTYTCKESSHISSDSSFAECTFVPLARQYSASYRRLKV